MVSEFVVDHPRTLRLGVHRHRQEREGDERLSVCDTNAEVVKLVVTEHRVFTAMIDSRDRVGGIDSCGRLRGDRNVGVVDRRVDASVLSGQRYRCGNARTIKLLTTRKESSDRFCAIEGRVSHPRNHNGITKRETKVPFRVLGIDVSKTVVPPSDNYRSKISLECGLCNVLNITIPIETYVASATNSYI